MDPGKLFLMCGYVVLLLVAGLISTRRQRLGCMLGVVVFFSFLVTVSVVYKP